MQELIDQYKKDSHLHHFHILIGDKNKSRNQLVDFCENCLGCNTVANPCFVNIDFDRLLIGDVKEIVSRSFMKAEKGQKKIFCISFNSVTGQAQNALLKIVEEPTPETFFFLIAPRKDIFLPTVLSRAIFMEVGGDSSDMVDEVVKHIMSNKSVGGKMKVVEDVVKKIKDKKIERGVAREVVKKVIIELEKDAVTNSNSLKSLQKIDDYLGDMSASTKLLLEKVVLSI